jgi:hypothetical protein
VHKGEHEEPLLLQRTNIIVVPTTPIYFAPLLGMDAMDGRIGASSSQRHQLSPEGVATRATACFDPYTNIAVPVPRIAEFDLEVLQNDASLCATQLTG